MATRHEQWTKCVFSSPTPSHTHINDNGQGVETTDKKSTAQTTAVWTSDMIFGRLMGIHHRTERRITYVYEFPSKTLGRKAAKSYSSPSVFVLNTECRKVRAMQRWNDSPFVSQNRNNAINTFALTPLLVASATRVHALSCCGIIVMQNVSDENHRNESLAFVFGHSAAQIHHSLLNFIGCQLQIQ